MPDSSIWLNEQKGFLLISVNESPLRNIISSRELFKYHGVVTYMYIDVSPLFRSISKKTTALSYFLETVC